jgi:hypothetical protein
MNRRFRSAATVGLLVLCVSAVHATNLLNNPDFDSDLNSWMLSNGAPSPTWDGSMGYPASGSVSIMSPAYIRQCVAIAGGQNVDLTIYTKGDSCGSSYGSELGARIVAYDVPDCMAPSALADVNTHPMDTVSGWNMHRIINYPLPAATQSVAIRPWVNPSSTTLTLNFDHVDFSVNEGATAPTGLINADFDNGICGWEKGPGSNWSNSVGSPSPGSAAFIAGSSPATAARQCLNIEEQNIDLVVRTLGDDALREGQNKYFLGVMISQYAQPGCSGSYLGSAQTSSIVTLLYGWNLHQLRDYPLAAGTQSVFLSLTAYDILTHFPDANFDHPYMGPARLFVDGFE